MGLNCAGCIACCGVIPVSEPDLRKIKARLKKMSRKEIDRLRKQKRHPLACPLVDVEKKRCSVYQDRPLICRMFGHYKDPMLTCKLNGNERFAVKPASEARKHADNYPVYGMLGVHFTWETGLLD